MTQTSNVPPGTWPVEREEQGHAPFLASGRLLGVLVVLCLVLAGAGALGWLRSEDRAQGAPSEVITSGEARDTGLQAAQSLTGKVLSYDARSFDADLAAAEAVMAPSFRAEYAKTMGGVRAEAVRNQVRLTADVVAASVISASEGRVVALVFVNQVTTAKGAGNQRLDQNRVRVTLTRDGGDWRVSQMDAF